MQLRSQAVWLKCGANSPPNLTFSLPLPPFLVSSLQPSISHPLSRSWDFVLLNCSYSELVLLCSLIPSHHLCTKTRCSFLTRPPLQPPRLAPPPYLRQLCPPWITTWKSILRGRPSHTTSRRQATLGPYRRWMAGSRV